MTIQIQRAVDYVHSCRDQFLADLKELVRIPSVSFQGFDPRHVEHAAVAVASLLKTRGFENVDILRVPGAHPYVYGDWMHAPGAPTLLLYAHHDVQPPGREELWKSPPFEPTQRSGRLYGRGTVDNKAAITVYTSAFAAHLRTASDLPVNIKILVEGEEEIGSRSLEAFVKRHAKRLSADAIVIHDTGNLDTGAPSVTTSLRGLVAFDVTVRSSAKPVHSGVWGGPVPDPVQALSKMIASLSGPDGRMAIPGIDAKVRTPSEAEMKSLRSLPFDERAFRVQSGMLPQSRFVGNGKHLLGKIWFEPALSVNAIQASSRKEWANIINDVAWCHLGIRTVPDMDPKDVARRLKAHLLAHAPWGVQVEFSNENLNPAWRTDPDSPVFAAAARALELGFGRKAVFVGCGGSIGFVEPFVRVLGGVPAILIGIGDPCANHHAENESIHVGDYFKSIASAVHLYRELSSPALWAKRPRR
ncbi:MAG: M20/M25/M40 family metallo-hydrolase [Elusimicrobia bacterium]|nr:M20/M25/M40 family metallo-hydrolase [Elusimicrobiota bacterium]